MTSRATRLLGLSLLAPLAFVSACDDAPAREPISLAFAATVGDEPFVCGQTFTGLGASADQSLTIRDARMYVHNVRLVTREGDEVALRLDEDAFQHDGLAYIDFADSGIAGCEGNPETRLVINGTAPGRQSDDQITLFDGTGVGLQDLAVAASVVDLALAAGTAINVDF